MEKKTTRNYKKNTHLKIFSMLTKKGCFSDHLVKKEKYNGRKLSKMHLTKFVKKILLCANADGSEKKDPLVIGKSKNPHCFKHNKSFNTKYSHNKSHG